MKSPGFGDIPTGIPYDQLYDSHFIRSLFNEMSQTYGIVNMISSMGFTRRWRRQCLNIIPIVRGARALDLMTGMGELCPGLSQKLGEKGHITAIDISPIMCRLAHKHGMNPNRRCPTEVIEADALSCPLKECSSDVIVSSFGLKTFDKKQIQVLATEVARVLRPGGHFSFLEISIPPSKLLRWPYLVYLDFIIPIVGRLFMGNPDNYRLLGVYTRAFGNCREAQKAFEDVGLTVEYRSFFFGCATAICGSKP